MADPVVIHTAHLPPDDTQEALFSNLNDLHELQVEGPSLVGRTLAGLGPAQKIAIGGSLAFDASGNLSFDASDLEGQIAVLQGQVSTLQQQVNLLLLTTVQTPSGSATFHGVGALIARAGQAVAVKPSVMAANAGLVANAIRPAYANASALLAGTASLAAIARQTQQITAILPGTAGAAANAFIYPLRGSALLAVNAGMAIGLGGGGTGTGYITSGLQVWYKFDDTVTTDSSGNNDTGALGGAPVPTLTTGKVGSALNFNNGGYVSFANTSGIGLASASSECSITAWINTSDGTDSNVIFGLRNTGNGNPIINFGLGWMGAGGTVGCPAALVRGDDGSGLTACATAVTVNDGTWHHLAFTRTSAKVLSIYIDGVVQATATDTVGSAITTNTGSVFVGQEVLGGWNARGTIDDFRYYNRALTSTEVGTIASLSESAGPAGAPISLLMQTRALLTVASAFTVPVNLRMAPTATFSGAGGMIAAANVPLVASAWDPANSGNITFSNSNRTITPSSFGVGSVRGTKSNNSGKQYFEVTMTTLDTGSTTSNGAGLCDINYSAWTSVIGGDTAGRSVGILNNQAIDFIVMYQNANLVIEGALIPASGQVIGVAVDFTVAGSAKIYFSVNGTWSNAGANSTTLTTPDYTWSTSSVLYPMASVTHAGITSQFVLNVGNAAFAYTLPSGFTAWG